MNLLDNPALALMYDRCKAFVEKDFGPGSLSEAKFIELCEQGQQALSAIAPQFKRYRSLEDRLEDLETRVAQIEGKLNSESNDAQ